MVQKVNIHLILVSLIPNIQFNFTSYLTKPSLTVTYRHVYSVCHTVLTTLEESNVFLKLRPLIFLTLNDGNRRREYWVAYI